jgi:hypothetical protein
MAQIITATSVYFQLYICSTIGQVHVSKGTIFVKFDLLFPKINMVKPTIHCLGSACLFILFCFDYDPKTNV